MTFAGCGGNTEPTKNTTDAAAGNLANSNANSTASTDNSSPLNTVKTPTPETVNEAPQLSAVVTAYCDAIRKKDDAALKQIYAAASYRQLEVLAKEESYASVAQYLNETEPVGNEPCRTRNEQINGNNAIAEVTNESYPTGTRFQFVKENNQWKLTSESPDVPVK